jgi:hypothetical protein
MKTAGVGGILTNKKGMLTGLVRRGRGISGASREHVTKPLGFINCGELLTQLSNY